MFFAKIFLLCTVSCVLVAAIPGGIEELHGEALALAQLELLSSLAKLAGGDGPYYTVAKVLKATSHVAAGIIYNFTVELVDKNGVHKECNVKILGQAVEPMDRQMRIACPNELEVIIEIVDD
ncbi:hypothetical protein KR018_004175 [Drosophila ironensis]|nr:hypothetical protein KR018_004175 [Drosophila ironensis]